MTGPNRTVCTLCRKEIALTRRGRIRRHQCLPLDDDARDPFQGPGLQIYTHEVEIREIVTPSPRASGTMPTFPDPAPAPAATQQEKPQQPSPPHDRQDYPLDALLLAVNTSRAEPSPVDQLYLNYDDEDGALSAMQSPATSSP